MSQTGLGKLLAWAEQKLAPLSDTARVDARVLLQHITRYSHAGLISHNNDLLPEKDVANFRALILKRGEGTPVAYLTGEREFWSMSLKVTPTTLIPRPETELLVEQALAHIPDQQTFVVTDIGTGCGAVALAIGHERTRIAIIATDISEEAVSVAKWNSEHLGIRNVEFRIGHLLSPLGNKCCDIIVSNPPYIPENDAHLTGGDVAFEPRSALVSGTDGLDAIRQIARNAPDKLKSGGWLLLEHGFDQASQVSVILQQAGFTRIKTLNDLSGHERMTQGQLA
ncbi:MAG: peptide chain release factor N(5)-glutamine methyltransferase [Acidiferrobacterales bacterium]